ncbi:hypothetical protein A2W12_01985 [Candidatus Nomurabacteria bacterium RBG_16_40_11]|nr:MAG: hypothetical protein A2W12_01985 [Candidatus Nomurabacteria bacterium RBG_16_40_11]
MKHRFSKGFLDELDSFPILIEKKFQKQLKFLLSDIRYSSLRAKKYIESKGIWQARVDDNVRFYFKIEGDTYVLINIKYHPK